MSHYQILLMNERRED